MNDLLKVPDTIRLEQERDEALAWAVYWMSMAFVSRDGSLSWIGMCIHFPGVRKVAYKAEELLPNISERKQVELLNFASSIWFGEPVL